MGVDPNVINERNRSNFAFSCFLSLEYHILVDLILNISGSIICGYWCARIIHFIFTDLYSNTLTNIVLYFSMVYMIFYLGKAETNTKQMPPSV